jgi:hypothetical protein
MPLTLFRVSVRTIFSYATLMRLTPLQVNPLITVLRLGGNRIGNIGAEALSEALATDEAYVQALHLEGNQVCILPTAIRQ